MAHFPLCANHFALFTASLALGVLRSRTPAGAVADDAAVYGRDSIQVRGRSRTEWTVGVHYNEEVRPVARARMRASSPSMSGCT